MSERSIPTAARRALTFKVNDTLTITPRIMLQRADYNGFPLADYRSTPGNGYRLSRPVTARRVPLPRPLYPSSFTQARDFNVPEGGYDPWALYSIAAQLENRFRRIRLLDRLFRSQGGSRPRMRATSSTRGSPSGVPGGTPQPGGIEEIKDYQRFVEEVRFASDLKGPVQFVIGGFYSDFHGRLPFAAYYPAATVPGLDATFRRPGR